jgi:hypothetical protein
LALVQTGYESFEVIASTSTSKAEWSSFGTSVLLISSYFICRSKSFSRGPYSVASEAAACTVNLVGYDSRNPGGQISARDDLEQLWLSCVASKIGEVRLCHCCRLGRHLFGDLFHVHDVAFLVDMVFGHANIAIRFREQRVIFAHSNIFSSAKLEASLPHNYIPGHYRGWKGAGLERRKPSRRSSKCCVKNGEKRLAKVYCTCKLVRPDFDSLKITVSIRSGKKKEKSLFARPTVDLFAYKATASRVSTIGRRTSGLLLGSTDPP